jgi:O-antigen ligase
MRGIGGLIGLAYLPVALAAILLSASRGGAFAAVVAMMLVPIGFAKMSHLRKVAVAGSLVIAVIAAALTVPDRSWERLMTIDDEASTRWTLGNLENLDLMNMRVAIWKEGLDQFKESPFVGVGAGGYLNVVDPVHGERRVAHNIFLSILVELGMIGLLLFVLMMTMLFVSTRHLPSDERLTWIFVLGTYLVGGLFLSWEHTKQTWMIVGLLAARFTVTRTARKPKRQEIPDETRAVIARHMERQRWDKARELVIDLLITREELRDSDTVETLFERLSEMNDDWPDVASVADYFDDRLSYVPPTVVEWRELAEEWSEKLRRLLVSDF